MRTTIISCLLALMAMNVSGQSDFYYNQAHEDYVHQRFKSAIKWFSLSIAKEPGHKCDSYQLRSIARTLSGDLAGAKLDVDSAFMTCPNAAYSWFAKGMQQYYSRNADAAIQSYTKAIELDPGTVKYYVNRAEAYGMKEDSVNFKKDLYKAIEVDSTDYHGYFNLGVFYKNAGQYQKARPLLQKAFRLLPGLATLLPLSFCELQLKNYKEAADLCTQALSADIPQADLLAELYITRGQAFAGLHQKKEACEDFTKAEGYGAAKSKEMKEKYCK